MTPMTETPQGGDLLVEMGQELKREREMRGVSLREIADATKISMRYLGALETGEARLLPAPVFVRGFVREYARYLGIDSDDAVDRYMRSIGALEKQEEAELRKQHPALKDYDPTQDEGKVRAIITGVVVLLLAGLLTASIWFFRQSLAEMVGFGESPADPAVEAAREGGPIPRAIQPEQATDTAGAESDVRPMHMVLEFRSPTWIHLLVDGETAVQETVNTGSVREFDAKEQIEIRTIGNAGGVTITIDGKELPPLGREREVVRGRVFRNPAAEESSE